MVPEDLVVWLEACDPAALGDRRPGLLCRRHADAMVVPVGWTLDDHREAVPRLFKVRQAAAPARPAGDHTGRMRRPRLEQASLLDAIDPPAAAEPGPAGASGPDAPPPAGADVTEPAVPPAEPVGEAAAGEPAWAPQFDRDDDLDGLLAPRGRLLRRAFGAEPRS